MKVQVAFLAIFFGNYLKTQFDAFELFTLSANVAIIFQSAQKLVPLFYDLLLIIATISLKLYLLQIQFINLAKKLVHKFYKEFTGYHFFIFLFLHPIDILFFSKNCICELL